MTYTGGKGQLSRVASRSRMDNVEDMENNMALPLWAQDLNDFNSGRDWKANRPTRGVEGADAITALHARRTAVRLGRSPADQEPDTGSAAVSADRPVADLSPAKTAEADPVGGVLDRLARELADTGAPGCERTPVKSRAGYSFPISGAALEDLDRELNELMDVYHTTSPYSAVRERFCAVSLALNEALRLAPAFRRQPRPRPAAAGKGKNDLLLHKDRLVIDLHWLWVRNIGVGTAKPQYARLLDSTAPFDFALAASFASENWSSEERATEQFALSEAVQWELATLKSRVHTDTHRMIFDGGRDGSKRVPSRSAFVRGVIARWAEESRPIRDQQAAYLHLWIAREMLGANGSAKRVGRLAALMCGRSPLDASTVRAKLKGLDRRLAASAR